LLGHHFVEAGKIEAAIDYLLLAARQAIGRSAAVEAEAQLRKALNLLQNLPDSNERRLRELDLQSTLIVTLMQTKGYATPAVAETLYRARELCEQLDRPPQFANLLYVHCGYRILRGDLLLACEDARQHRELAESQNDSVVKATACFNSATVWSHRGDFETARACAEQTLEAYDPDRGAAYAAVSPHDPQIAALGSLCDMLSCLGFPDQARMRRDEALVTARQRRHANRLALALACAWSCDARLGLDPAPLLDRATELHALCAKHGLPHFAAQTGVYLGSSLSSLGDADRGLPLLREGLSVYRAAGAVISVPRILVLLADGYRSAGLPQAAIGCLDEAARLIEVTEARGVEAHIYRQRGELLLVAGDLGAAESDLLRAAGVARRQNARFFELQAVSGLARLWRDRGEPAKARDRLAPVYAWFTGGFDVPALRHAKALLDQLR
jgi:tetratricopeptide (TPR) repeat protein